MYQLILFLKIKFNKNSAPMVSQLFLVVANE